MRWKSRLIVAIAAALAACQTSDSEITAPRTSKDLSAILPTEVTADSLLQFVVRGPNKATNPGYATYRIDWYESVGSHDVYWYVERCWDGEVSCRAPIGGPSGTNLDTLRYYVDAELTEFRVIAQVIETATGRTGAKSMKTLGPWGFTYSTAPLSFCDESATMFPFEGQWQPPSGQPDSGVEYYYRDACDGSRVWSGSRWSYTPPN